MLARSGNERILHAAADQSPEEKIDKEELRSGGTSDTQPGEFLAGMIRTCCPY